MNVAYSYYAGLQCDEGDNFVAANTEVLLGSFLRDKGLVILFLINQHAAICHLICMSSHDFGCHPQMVLSLVNLCAREVVSDHSSSPYWLSCVPRELYRALLDAAFSHCRPLAVGELIQRWPERTLTIGGSRKSGQCLPNRLCVQALLLAVVRGLTDKRYGCVISKSLFFILMTKCAIKETG